MSRRDYVDGHSVPWPEEWRNAPRARVVDFRCECHGSVWLVYPMNPRAHRHLVEHVGPDATWFGDARVWTATAALAVEPRYIEQLVVALKDAGFTVTP